MKAKHIHLMLNICVIIYYYKLNMFKIVSLFFIYSILFLFSIIDLSTVKKEYESHSIMQLDQSACGKFIIFLLPPMSSFKKLIIFVCL